MGCAKRNFSLSRCPTYRTLGINGLKRRWVKQSVQDKTSTDCLADFLQFVEFAQSESEEANSLFDLRSLSAKVAKPTSKAKVSSYGVSKTVPEGSKLTKDNAC